MTREEREIAVKEFKEWRDSYYNKNKLPTTMFIEEVIKALEQEPCEDCIEIPEGATNGDMIKAMFPNFRTDEMSHTVWVGYDDMSFRRDWWNSPYRKEQK